MVVFQRCYLTTMKNYRRHNYMEGEFCSIITSESANCIKEQSGKAWLIHFIT